MFRTGRRPPHGPWWRAGVASRLAGWCVGCLLAVACPAGLAHAATQHIRVGLYENLPKVGTSADGAPQGIFVDILNEIARREGWVVTYVPGTWEQGLARLEADSLDLMPDMAYSEARATRFSFNQIAVLGSWLQIYSRRGTALGSVSDLRGKSVAVLRESIQQQVCSDLDRQMGLSLRQVALPDYEATLRAVESGTADAAIVGRFFGYRREPAAGLVATPVILHPTALHFAAPKKADRALLDRIDARLAAMMDDPHSAYYRSLGRWLDEEPRSFVPAALLWAMAFACGAVLALVVLSFVLRWQVAVRTEALERKNAELAAAMRDLAMAREESLKRERLHTLGQLAAGVAHDFCNLLVPIAGHAELLLDDLGGRGMGENAREELLAIKAAAERGQEIVRRMQDFHRSAQAPESVEPLDANAIVQEVLELARPRLTVSASGASPVDVVANLGQGATIMGVRSKVHEMLLNLVLNAADAMPTGGRLEVTTFRAGHSVVITVRDTGVGMTEEVRQRCLEPFFTTKGAQGTGMGLAMVSAIVSELGGTMQIASAVGAGTTFTLTLPEGPGNLTSGA